MSVATKTGSARKARRGEYIPSPEQIRQACLEIQNSWTEKERTRRLLGSDGFETLEWEVVRNIGSDSEVRVATQRASSKPAVHVSLPRVERAQAN